MNDDKRIISFDWAVKRMLRDKANFGVLEGLMTVLIGEQMKIVEILESESNQDTASRVLLAMTVKRPMSPTPIRPQDILPLSLRVMPTVMERLLMRT
jgi:hypothetical protein